MDSAEGWTMGTVEVVSVKHIPIRRERTLIPTRKSCPVCKFDGIKPKGGKNWEPFYWAERPTGGHIVLTCRKCEGVLKTPF